MKKTLVLVLAALLVVGLSTSAFAAKSAESKPASLHGKIVKVDGANVTVKTGRGDAAKEVVVATDDNTKVTVDGKDAKVADLKADMFVKVTPTTGTATEIKAMTKRPTRGGGHGGAGAGGNN